MSDSLSDLFLSLVDFSPVSRVRRNHGLEHATLNLLAAQNPKRSIAGHSDMGGFWILGDVSTEELQETICQALHRLQAGEHDLAVHPNCGTNIATAGILSGGVASLAMFGSGPRTRDKLERIPLAIMLATLALIIAQPLGLFFQKRFTTVGDPEGMEIVEIIPTQRGRIKAHRIVTAG